MPDDVFPGSPPTVTDVGIRDIEVVLFRGNDASQSARYSIQVLRSDGSIDVRTGNLVPHLTNAEVNGLIALMNRVRTKAQSVWGNG